MTRFPAWTEQIQNFLSHGCRQFLNSDALAQTPLQIPFSRKNGLESETKLKLSSPYLANKNRTDTLFRPRVKFHQGIK